MFEGDDNEVEELKYLNVQVEAQSGSLRVNLNCQSGYSLSLIDSDCDYSWVSPLMFLRLDDLILKFVFESLILFRKYVQKKYSGGGSEIQKLVEKYGHHIVLAKLDTEK
jgi:hypothetical protein